MNEVEKRHGACLCTSRHTVTDATDKLQLAKCPGTLTHQIGKSPPGVRLQCSSEGERAIRRGSAGERLKISLHVQETRNRIKEGCDG